MSTKEGKQHKMSLRDLVSWRKIKPRGLVSSFYFKTKNRIGACQIETRRKAKRKMCLKLSPRVNVLLPITFCTFAMGVRLYSNVA